MRGWVRFHAPDAVSTLVLRLYGFTNGDVSRCFSHWFLIGFSLVSHMVSHWFFTLVPHWFLNMVSHISPKGFSHRSSWEWASWRIIENGGMARVDWDCARGVGNEGAINGAFDAGFAPEFCSTRRFLGALEPARAGSCENAVVHPVRIVEEKAEHDGQREASCDRKKGRRKRVPFAWRVRMCWARLHCVELRMLMLRQT